MQEEEPMNHFGWLSCCTLGSVVDARGSNIATLRDRGVLHDDQFSINISKCTLSRSVKPVSDMIRLRALRNLRSDTHLGL